MMSLCLIVCRAHISLCIAYNSTARFLQLLYPTVNEPVRLGDLLVRHSVHCYVKQPYQVLFHDAYASWASCAAGSPPSTPLSQVLREATVPVLFHDASANSASPVRRRPILRG